MASSRFPQGYRSLTRSELRERGLSPKSERVLTPSGDLISRRQAENLRFEHAGISYSTFQRISAERNPATGNKDFQRWAETLAEKRGVSKREVTNDPEFIRLYMEARRDDWKHDIGGPFDMFLQFLGLRQPDLTYDIGDTP